MTVPAPQPDPDTGDTDAGLARLEIRVQPTQARLLDSMARRLTRERRKAGRTRRDRINKSTLIRAAVAVLTDARGAIHGATEAEIADSLRHWLATGPNGDLLPRQTRDAIRDARRQLTAADRLLDQAAHPAPASVDQADSGAGQALSSTDTPPAAIRQPETAETP